MTAQFRADQFSGLADLAVVAIGRNEGERLERCLSSALENCKHVVYVDSGSTDGSAEMARTKGATVIALDMSKPFTAARARNQGLATILEESSGSLVIRGARAGLFVVPILLLPVIYQG